MLGKIIWLIVLIVLFILNVVFYFKSKNDKAFLNLIAAGFVFIAIIVQIDTIKDYRPEEDIKTKVELENGKETRIKITGVSMNCPNCNTRIWSDENFCKKCGYKKNLSEFDEKDYHNMILYHCPYCNETVSSSNDFCTDCGKNLIEIKKEVIKEVKSR